MNTPTFDSPEALADWLESLHECYPDGAATSRKWEAAQVAARVIRSMGQQTAPRAALEAALSAQQQCPIPMLLFCPKCRTQHIDKPDDDASAHPDGRESRWDNPPHRSHLCHACRCIWRPADVPTTGVERIETRGKADNFDLTAQQQGQGEVAGWVDLEQMTRMAKEGGAVQIGTRSERYGRTAPVYWHPAPPAQPASRDRAAYEGAREDLLDWKGRALRAEATLRSLGYKGVDASEPPAQLPEWFMEKVRPAVKAAHTKAYRSVVDAQHGIYPSHYLPVLKQDEKFWGDLLDEIDAVLAGKANQPAQPAEREEMSPEFTDSARAAIAWVLYHHQGGSSPVGQPLRFALGMGAHEHLPDWRIDEAKRWAARVGATTEQFHRQPAERVPEGWVLVPREALGYVSDLLAERQYGNAARSPAHNARIVVDYWLASPAPSPARRDGGE